MRTRRRATIQDLRLAVDCLPRHTRIAMLQGIAANEIIVGAYTNQDGICPMLAAHRAGGRTDLIAFAKAWDRFALRDGRPGRARRATERELRVLKVYLEASLLAEDAPGADLAAARREHAALKQARARAEDVSSGQAPVSGPPRPGDPGRSRELAGQPGWAWSRLVRRYDDYERVLARLESEPAVIAAGAREPAGEAALSR